MLFAELVAIFDTAFFKKEEKEKKEKLQPLLLSHVQLLYLPQAWDGKSAHIPIFSVHFTATAAQ
jgi:hypothetical protein